MDGLVLVAAGRGERLGAPGPKALVDLAGEPLFLCALRALLALGPLDVVVAAPPTHVDVVAARLPPGARAIPGGLTRQDSVARGVAALDPAVAVVLVHDAARPLVDAALARAVLEAARAEGAAAAVVPVRDTLHREEADGRLAPGVPRADLRRAQTPQGARRPLLDAALAAAAQAGAHFTDEAALLLWHGAAVRAVPGSERNLKVTTPEDLALVRALLEAAGPRPTAGRAP